VNTECVSDSHKQSKNDYEGTMLCTNTEHRCCHKMQVANSTFFCRTRTLFLARQFVQ